MEIQIPKSALQGSRRSTGESRPILRGNLPDSVDEVIDVPVSLTGFDTSDEIDVLYVDDNQELTELTKLYLEQDGDDLSVTTTTNAVQALELLHKNEFDCVVSDYDMPNTDGIELLKIVRETYPNLPFILFTAKGAERVASEAFTAGATDYMQKDIGKDQYVVLADRVRNAVEQYRMQQCFWNALSWYQKLVEQNFTGVFLVRNEELLYVNRRLADLLGYSQTDLVGTDPVELASTPEDEERLQNLTTLDCLGEDRFQFEASITRRDGSDISVEVQAETIQHEGDLACIGLFREQADGERAES